MKHHAIFTLQFLLFAFVMIGTAIALDKAPWGYLLLKIKGSHNGDVEFRIGPMPSGAAINASKLSKYSTLKEALQATSKSRNRRVIVSSVKSAEGVDGLIDVPLSKNEAIEIDKHNANVKK